MIEIIAVVFVGVISAALCAAGLYGMNRATARLNQLERNSDQKCPHCGTWQSEQGGWSWVGSTENPEIDFAAECGFCGAYSYWVWIGPGVCVPFEEIEKQQVGK